MNWKTIFDGILTNLGLDKDKGFSLVCFINAAIFLLLAFAAAFQLLRIQCRVSTMGCTTQKLFHFLVLFATGVRAVTFICIPFIKDENVHPVTNTLLILWDVPDLVFFSTYSLLLVFWAEIYYYARNQPRSAIERLRPAFICVNLIIYILSVIGWILRTSVQSVNEDIVIIILRVSRSMVTLGLAISYMYYGGRLFFMLRRFPIESRIRQKKLTEVGLVTCVCTLQDMFLVCSNLFFAVNLEAEKVWWVMGVYFFFAEALPTAMVLTILRQLPPRRAAMEDNEYVDLKESLI